MNVGVYQGAASLSALEHWQQVISENIASASTAGFKKTESSFASVLGEVERVGDGLLGPSDPNVQPQAIDNPSVLNGQIEGSNVSPLQEMVNLVSVSRAYEASQRVIFANDENTGKAIETLGNPNS